MTEPKKLLSSTQATNRYRAKKKAQRFIFDLYLGDDVEKRIAEILDKQKDKKNLKKYIIEAVKNYEKLE